MSRGHELFVSVDVETAGPSPALYSLLSIGACLVDSPGTTFYVEMCPVSTDQAAEAMAVHGLSLEQLQKTGMPPGEAMARFEQWVNSHVHQGQRPVFVAFNAPFDWMFVNDYFHRFLGRNPFGHSALDMKALYMGLTGSNWSDTSMAQVAARYAIRRQLTHNALKDALDQAELFRRMLFDAAPLEARPAEET